MEKEADFVLICNLAKMRFWNPLHFTPQIIFQNQSVFEKVNVNELSLSQIIDEGSMTTNLVTILEYFLKVRGDHPVPFQPTVVGEEEDDEDEEKVEEEKE